MTNSYSCKNSRRRQEVLRTKLLNGIDFLEVTSVDQTVLDLHFIHPLPGQLDEIPAPPNAVPALGAANFIIEGGVRIKNPKVEAILAQSGRRVTLKVRERGDFSLYTLRLVTSATLESPPPGFDPRLAAVEFAFKVACPSEFDCLVKPICSTQALPEPEINYLAKDYASFRTVMIDRLSQLMPQWQERHPADLQMALVELLAYVGDQLSYFQDAVATEAYLGTARQRVSVRRHARLLDYFMHDGCNARTWICVTLPAGGGSAQGKVLARGTPVLLGQPQASPVIDSTKELEAALQVSPMVFETCHDLTLRESRNAISFYTWSGDGCCLPRGSVQATLRNDPPLALRAGEVLVFEEVLNPTTGLEADADPAHRWAVRLTQVLDTDALKAPLVDPLTGQAIVEILWHSGDALPFPLCLNAIITGANGIPVLREVSVARGNVALADHGFTLTGLELPQPVEEEPYQPLLPASPVTMANDYSPVEQEKQPASVTLRQSVATALPVIRLQDQSETWVVRRDLLSSDRFATDVVAETDDLGRVTLRFGDDILGKKPEPGTHFKVTLRVGCGSLANVGANALGRIFCPYPDLKSVRNPLPALGGTEPESKELVRFFAPQAFRSQERAVTEADYAAAAERHPEVLRAQALFRWTGSWHTVFLTIDRALGKPVVADPPFLHSVRAHLERFRLAGYDLEIQDPLFVALELVARVCVKPGYFQAAVKEALLEEWSRHTLDNQRTGLFHPDNFTFGQPLFLSQLCERALGVAGVSSITIVSLSRFGQDPDDSVSRGFFQPAPQEIVRLDNDGNFPENGLITLDLHGGL